MSVFEKDGNERLFRLDHRRMNRMFSDDGMRLFQFRCIATGIGTFNFGDRVMVLTGYRSATAAQRSVRSAFLAVPDNRHKYRVHWRAGGIACARILLRSGPICCPTSPPD